MPDVPLRWRHIIVNTKNTWLHGDVRGFRDRDHRKHSSGDYKNPPPIEENEDLRKYFLQRTGDPVFLPSQVRPLIASAFAARLKKEKFQVLAISVSANHVHLLVEFPDDPPTIRLILGRCKRDAVDAIRPYQTGEVWSAGGELKPIKDREHHGNTFTYITTKQEAGAWIWTFRGETYWMGEDGPLR